MEPSSLSVLRLCSRIWRCPTNCAKSSGIARRVRVSKLTSRSRFWPRVTGQMNRKNLNSSNSYLKKSALPWILSPNFITLSSTVAAVLTGNLDLAMLRSVEHSKRVSVMNSSARPTRCSSCYCSMRTLSSPINSSFKWHKYLPRSSTSIWSLSSNRRFFRRPRRYNLSLQRTRCK